MKLPLLLALLLFVAPLADRLDRLEADHTLDDTRRSSGLW